MAAVVKLDSAKIKALKNNKALMSAIPALKEAYAQGYDVVAYDATCPPCAKRSRGEASGEMYLARAIAGLAPASQKKLKELLGADTIKLVYRDKKGNRQTHVF